jgi:hypothetical protein
MEAIAKRQTEVPDTLVEARIEAAAEVGPGPLHTHPARRVNCHGVFREVDFDLRMTREKGAGTRAEIRVIEDIQGWFVATSWTLERGQYRGSSAPLSIHDQPLDSRAEALEEGRERILRATRQAAENDHRSVEKAKREAAEIHEWVRKAIEQPEWFHKMTPDDIGTKDGGRKDEENEEKDDQKRSGRQESLF